ncbi:MAG: hypothetical protein A2Z50_00210 [Nitrospirae bacterium RBG_19FT_COMBO_42_15]|nr:MAG: hypothetical protein A2Z50_00210 [Nitrospirae bacterium RBG_19FT_COMBO_42_15]
MKVIDKKSLLRLFCILLLFLPSCMFFGSSKPVYTKPAKAYKIDAPSGEWKILDIENIDAAYWNDKHKTGMAFAVDCSADKKGDINTIANRLFIGIKNRRIFESREVTLSERNAATVTAKGILSNKSLIIKAYSIIDDNCIYDFAYWTFKDSLEEDGIRDFEIFVKSLKLSPLP